LNDLAKPGVVYLARKADGIGALHRFVASYLAHSSGLSHDLMVIFKGFKQQGGLQEAKDALRGIEYRGLELADVGFDIGAYLECARRVSNRYLVFLNTHSEIAAPGWLAALARYGLAERVGIAGAMGSYESLHDTVLVLKDVIWKCIGAGNNYDRNLAHYFDFVLRRYHRRWYSSTGDVITRRYKRPGYFKKIAVFTARLLYYPWFAVKGTRLIWPGAPRFDVGQFPRFPNPHIRSNGFMVRRDRWLQLNFSPSKKVDTSLFESGPQSFTTRMRDNGMSTIVVGQDGNGYDVPDWPHSRTFRLGDQSNLLIHDNHTRAFEAMSPGARVTHAWMSWGDYLGPLPADFPEFEFRLREASFLPNAKATSPANAVQID
jgi:hypothetical protein